MRGGIDWNEPRRIGSKNGVDRGEQTDVPRGSRYRGKPPLRPADGMDALRKFDRDGMEINRVVLQQAVTGMQSR